ncbi:MAG: tRNA 2-thiouridine(34) synthase MnmA [Treponemataceae bacterium]|nr:tRNA 2-thiouridine(34) synthase MnmA [Treponemataceae bacterium]
MKDFTFTEINQPQKGDTVLVGMSGGVDSTLVSLLLKEQGCKVIGVTMSSWNNDLPIEPSPDGLRHSCYGPDEKIDIETCQKFCEENDIEYHVISVKDEYKKNVLEYFKSEYRNGRTPNPCIMCNPTVKFGALLKGVENLGIKFDYFCTGHYAKLVKANIPLEEILQNENEKNFTKNENVNQFPIFISQAEDGTKDQAYFLNRIKSEVLEKIRFPLSKMTKKEVYEEARKRNLQAAEKSESQDFVPPEIFEKIFADVKSIPGNIIDENGKVLGKHRGIEFYTIGQRRGLGVSAKNPLYVKEINKTDNTVVLCENDGLLAQGLIGTNWVWAGNFAPEKPFYALVKIRLASKPVEALIEKAKEDYPEGSYKITFTEKQRAIAPGQSAVVYINGITIGGGIIEKAFS